MGVVCCIHCITELESRISQSGGELAAFPERKIYSEADSVSH